MDYFERKTINWHRISGQVMLASLSLIAVLLYAGIATVASRSALELAYSEHIDTPIVRNEWGQIKHNPDFMCEASIRKWLEACGQE